MKLIKALLNEETYRKQEIIKLEDLTYKFLLSFFDKKPRSEEELQHEFELPNSDGSYTVVYDTESLDSWKTDIAGNYGNVNIRLDREAAVSFERIKILDDKFIADREARADAEEVFTGMEKAAGRSID